MDVEHKIFQQFILIKISIEMADSWDITSETVLRIRIKMEIFGDKNNSIQMRSYDIPCHWYRAQPMSEKGRRPSIVSSSSQENVEL